MRFSTRISFFLALLWFLIGCADSKQPAGPDTGIPIFNLEADPSVIAPLQNTMLSLTPVLPLEFEELDGEEVLFSALPDSGAFFVNSWSWIDLDAATNLFPEVWYQYTGFGTPDTVKVAIFAHVVSQTEDTLAWDSCLVNVISN